MSFQTQKRTTFQSDCKIQFHSVVFVPYHWIAWSRDFGRFQEELAGIKNTERRQMPLSSPENLELISHFDQRHKLRS